VISITNCYIRVYFTFFTLLKFFIYHCACSDVRLNLKVHLFGGFCSYMLMISIDVVLRSVVLRVRSNEDRLDASASS